MKTTSTISCQQLEEFVVDFLDDKLPSGQRIIFSSHIDSCPKCEVYLDNYQKTIAVSQAAHKLQGSEGECAKMPEALVQAILASKFKKD